MEMSFLSFFRFNKIFFDNFENDFQLMQYKKQISFIV